MDNSEKFRNSLAKENHAKFLQNKNQIERELRGIDLSMRDIAKKYKIGDKKLRQFARDLGIDTTKRKAERARIQMEHQHKIAKAPLENVDPNTVEKALKLLEDISRPAEEIQRGLGISGVTFREIMKYYEVDLQARSRKRMELGYFGKSSVIRMDLSQTMSKDGLSLLWLMKPWKLENSYERNRY